MTPQHGYPHGGGGAAGRGIVLVIVAVALGAFLLARGFEGADGGSNAGAASPGSESDSSSAETDEDDSDTTDEAAGDTTTTTTTSPPSTTHRPNEVRVVAVNGKGETGLAGATVKELTALGYTAVAKNAVNRNMERSAIYYRPGYGEDAKAIAVGLNAPADILNPAPTTVLTLVEDPSDVSDFDIFVVLAADDVIPIVV